MTVFEYAKLVVNYSTDHLDISIPSHWIQTGVTLTTNKCEHLFVLAIYFFSMIVT